MLMIAAKRLSIPVFLIGHITKEGTIAGPKTLEHIVDTVLYFEGDKFQNYRVVRAVKNRFGPVNEVAIYQMHDTGLEEVPNPSAPSSRSAAERPARPSWPRSKGRAAADRDAGPRLATTFPSPVAWPSASTPTACRCCWPYWRSGRAATSWPATST